MRDCPVIRRMRPDDLDQVEAIEKVSFPTPWSLSMLESELNYPYSDCFVSEISNRITSYVFSRLVTDELHILNLAVHHDMRRKGYGGELINFMLHHSFQNGAKHAYLEVRTTNLSAIRLYQKTGFAIIRKRDRYYQDGSDAYVMGLSLQGFLK